MNIKDLSAVNELWRQVSSLCARLEKCEHWYREEGDNPGDPKLMLGATPIITRQDTEGPDIFVMLMDVAMADMWRDREKIFETLANTYDVEIGLFDGMTSFERWDMIEELNRKINHEGWCVVETTTGKCQIQLDERYTTFDHDSEARTYVILAALGGDKIAQTALRYVRDSSPRNDWAVLLHEAVINKTVQSRSEIEDLIA